MSREEGEDKTIYKVIVDHEHQYSIWPADRETPLGWSDAGKQGTRAECLAYIEEALRHRRHPGPTPGTSRRTSPARTSSECERHSRGCKIDAY